MALLVKSLDAVTSTGPGAALMFDLPRPTHSMGVTTTGSPDHVHVELEGTFDGVVWFGILQAVGSTSISNSADMPLMGIRANLTLMDGGTDPAVTAWIASAN